MDFGERIKNTFGWERFFCRLIAAWSSFVALVLLLHQGYFDIAFVQEEISLIDMGLATLGFFGIYSAVAFLAGRLHSDSWFLLLAATVCVCRWVSEYSGYVSGEQVCLAILVVYALFLFYVVWRNRKLFRSFDFGPKLTATLALVAGVTACVILAMISCLRYKTFSTPNFDFGIFCNMFYNMKESGLPMVTCERDRLLSHFAVHLSPAFYFLLPLYYVFPSPLTLQIGQALFLMAGVIPVWLLCRHLKYSGRTTVLLCCLYAFYPVISTGCFYDIHENCFLPFFLLWTFYFFEKGSYIPMYLSAVCVLFVKEDAAIYLLVFALYLFLSRKSRLNGVLLAVMAAAYFLFASYYLQKYGLGTMMDRYDNLIYDYDAGLPGILKTLLTNPGYLLTQLFTESNGGWDKIWFLLQMLLPVGLLPFCSKKPSRWLLITPILLNIITYYPYLYDTGFQYQFGGAAFLTYAMILNLGELRLPTRRALLTLAAAACCCLYLFKVTSTLAMYQSWWKYGKEDYKQMESILETVPEDASVCASTFLLPHLAQRDVIYEVDYHGYRTDVEYVVLDLRMKESVRYESIYRSRGYETYAEAEDLILILKQDPNFVYIDD